MDSSLEIEKKIEDCLEELKEIESNSLDEIMDSQDLEELLKYNIFEDLIMNNLDPRVEVSTQFFRNSKAYALHSYAVHDPRVGEFSRLKYFERFYINKVYADGRMFASSDEDELVKNVAKLKSILIKMKHLVRNASEKYKHIAKDIVSEHLQYFKIECIEMYFHYTQLVKRQNGFWCFNYALCEDLIKWIEEIRLSYTRIMYECDIYRNYDKENPPVFIKLDWELEDLIPYIEYKFLTEPRKNFVDEFHIFAFFIRSKREDFKKTPENIKIVIKST